MKKKITLLFMFMAFFFTSQAQEWVYYKDFPVNVSPRFVVSNNLGTIFMCASDNSLYYKLLNGGWTKMVSNQMQHPINPISISIDQNSNRMYVGDQFFSGLFYTSNFGASWQYLYFVTDPNSGFHEQISDLSNIRTPNLFFGNTDFLYPTIIKYTNYGQSAEFITYHFSFDPDYYADKLYFTSNQKLLIGTYGKGIWVGTNNGTSIAESSFNQYHIIDFAEGANGRVYALGINESQGNNFMIYSDDYINWEYMNLPTGNERFRTIYYDGFSQNLWLGSDRAIYKLNVSGSADTGWTGASLNNGVQSEVVILGDNHGGIYNFSDEKIAQKLNSDGSEWVDIDSGGLTGTVNKVLFGTNDRIYASSYMSKNISIAASQSAAWNNIFVSSEAYGIKSMYLTNQGVLYANTGKKIKKSVDNGLNFTDVTPSFVSNYIFSFYVGEAGDLFMVNSDEKDKLYVSHNQGSTWSLLHQFPSFSSFSPDLIRSVAQDSNGVIYVTMKTLEIFFDVYKVYYSTDSGVTWNTKIVQQPDLGRFDVEVFAKNNNVFVLLGNRVHKYIFNAQNDLTVVNLPPGFTNLSHIWLDNQGNYYAYDFGLYKSSDEGNNWTFLGSPASVSAAIIDDILFDSNNKPYIVATQTDQPSQRGIYYVNEILSSERPQYENDLIIFPVPAHNEITLSTSSQIEKIAVYDMLGKKIIEYNNPQNTIDVSCLSQGQYIVKIQKSDSKIITSKFIKQ